eukprot:CAMPEP_0201585114 /NCGR_PEP_ID=MMETSP0190_2-20130828/118317_1 /ASSEMBLY_ACC=CAM_ASM_000263 /TAXON_ID=37353 /ORGANISM="Rosalina sp." /LENGTH=89 /DNA_ID=CAMNT_0048030399 /DNA_START=23 /DNA_END=289 /DNA_ORIENTATION=+
MAAEQKKAYDEFTIECKDIELDQCTVTSNDIKQKQFSTSYKTKKESKNKTPGSLSAREFTMDKDDGTKLVSITFDVIAPAKDDDNDMDK